MAGAMFEQYKKAVRSDAARPLRFVFVGLAATFTHIALAGLMLLAAPQANPYLVNFLAYAVGFFVSYFGHRYLTFARTGSMSRFLLVAVAGFGLNNLLVATLLAASATPFVAIVIATAAVPVLTYLASSLWVFKRT